MSPWDLHTDLNQSKLYYTLVVATLESGSSSNINLPFPDISGEFYETVH